MKVFENESVEHSGVIDISLQEDLFPTVSSEAWLNLFFFSIEVCCVVTCNETKNHKSD